MFEAIKKYSDSLINEFDLIPSERKILLEKISNYISSKRKENKPVNLVYICTHNSRRSHFGQVWAKVAADYFQIENITTFSGGTEATAFHPNSVEALRRVGFVVDRTTEEKNPVYHIFHSENSSPSICYSKIHDHPDNPKKDFAAIMVCGEAEENCPFVSGMDLRIGTTYNDPKAFDNTPLQDEKYDERCRQIARECFYVFSKI